jgi:SAM-dependent methyltransferase
MHSPADFSRLFDEMRRSEMNTWVGGADPELVGDISAEILLSHLPPVPAARMLDFGCGIGRVGLAVLKQRPGIGSLTGFDIVPKLVDFCRSTIGATFANANFELVLDENDHYERYDRAKANEPPQTHADLLKKYGGSFDSAYAFSVFTHVDVNDFAPLLRFVGTLLKPGGRFLFTAFALTPFSRHQLAKGLTQPAFPKLYYEQDGAVLIGAPKDRLAFIAYDISRIEAMIWEAGLVPCEVEYGEWRSDRMSRSYQDVFVCRRPLE